MFSELNKLFIYVRKTAATAAAVYIDYGGKPIAVSSTRLRKTSKRYY